tara:strand:+ start:64 stop:381 length:318 start_codon:yes stop_codon:yes gene_type:complete
MPKVIKTKGGKTIEFASPTKSKLAAQRARAVTRKRVKRLKAEPPNKIYPLARGYYGVSRSPRVATAGGRPIKKGLAERKRLLERFLRQMERSPPAPFLAGLYGRK